MNKIALYLSKKGMKELKKTVARLERDQKQVQLALHEMDKTDGHDQRLERSERLSQLEALDSELLDKRAQLAHAKLFPRRRDAFKVALGSIVELIDANGRLLRYTVVDSIEANPSDGRISIKSPLGASLLGKQLHDIVEWSGGLTRQRMRLVAIH